MKKIYDKVIKVRVKSEEYELLSSMSQSFKMTKSGVIRRLVFQQRDYLSNWHEFIEPYKSLTFDSRNITNNINQIARYTNLFIKTNRSDPSMEPLIDLNSNISKYIELQNKIISLINKFLKTR